MNQAKVRFYWSFDFWLMKESIIIIMNKILGIFYQLTTYFIKGKCIYLGTVK